MKKILAVILSFTCLFSSFTFLTSAEENTEESSETSTETGTEHVHERFSYFAFYTETTHTYNCSTCDEYYTENHIPAEEDKCPCGYFDHEHKPETWLMCGVFSDDKLAVHSYICSECEDWGWVEEEHTFDENGNCPCGMVDLEKPNLNLFDMLRFSFSFFPSYINFMAKLIGNGIEIIRNII